MGKKAPLIAAIDIGTNSFHMAIASVNERGMMNIINREKEMVRLGESQGDMKQLSKEAMQRGVECLNRFAAIAESENATVRAIATSATREAQNKDVFVSEVKKKTGIDIEVVSGAEEGRLIYIGAIHALPIYDLKSFVLDIGGGSTETVIGYKGEARFINSTKIGTIRLTKQFFPKGRTNPDSIQECKEFIRGAWAPTLKRCSEMGFVTAVGTSGTIQNLAAISLSLKGEKVPEQINGLVVKSKDMLKVIDLIKSCDTPAKRAEIPGMDSKRADIITAGALIVESAIERLHIEKFLISSYALREGIIFETIKKNKEIQEYHHLSHLRYETVHSLAARYRVEKEHADHVKNLALRMYDDLQHIHGLSYAERELLEAASLLHDVGYHISHDQHHKHSYYIISHCVMPGFTNNESEVIANIARYHRKSHPKKKHENFAALTNKQQKVVKMLSGILRIAEGLDRRQLSLIRDVNAFSSEDHIIVKLFSAPGAITPDLELWGARRRKPLLEESLGREVRFELEGVDE